MKITCISDTHCRLRKIAVPEGDLLVHAGDLTFKGDIQEINQELRELGRIAKNFRLGCVLIAGNHDFLGERNPSLMKQMCVDNDITYLDHSSVTIEGLKIFGSAYTPFFHKWAFNVQRGEPLKLLWDQIPDDTNVLITHGPAMGILDPVKRFNLGEYEIEHVGCYDLLNRIQDLKQLRAHIFGHLHLGAGQMEKNGVIYVNAAICTEQYKPTNPPIVIEI